MYTGIFTATKLLGLIMKKFYSVTNVLIAINMVVMLIMLGVNYINYDTYKLQNSTLLNFGAIVPHQSSLLTIISAMFLHGSIWHILANMLSLKMLGDKMEALFGKSYLSLYFLSGIAGGLAAYFLGHNPTVGASGAICGLLSAVVVHAFKYEKTKQAKIGPMLDVILLIGIGFLPSISALGHGGGLIMGFIFALLYFHINNEKILKDILDKENLKQKENQALIEDLQNNPSNYNDSLESKIIFGK